MKVSQLNNTSYNFGSNPNTDTLLSAMSPGMAGEKFETWITRCQPAFRAWGLQV